MYMYVLENVVKIGGDFRAIFWKKSMDYSPWYFQKLAHFFKMLITQKNICRNQLKLST